jgi:hypothetical protein
MPPPPETRAVLVEPIHLAWTHPVPAYVEAGEKSLEL